MEMRQKTVSPPYVFHHLVFFLCFSPINEKSTFVQFSHDLNINFFPIDYLLTFLVILLEIILFFPIFCLFRIFNKKNKITSVGQISPIREASRSKSFTIVFVNQIGFWKMRKKYIWEWKFYGLVFHSISWENDELRKSLWNRKFAVPMLS